MKYSSLVPITLLSITFTACGSDRNDPTGTIGSVSPGAGRANEEFTESNMFVAFLTFLEMINDINSKAIDVTQTLQDPSQPTRITGAYYSNATVNVIDPDTSGAGAGYTGYLRVDFSDYYSDNGLLYISGWLEIYSEWTSSKLITLHLSGNVEFSGDYDCGVQFTNFPAALQSDGQLVDLPRLVSGDTTYIVPLKALSTAGDVYITHQDDSRSKFYPHHFAYSFPPYLIKVP